MDYCAQFMIVEEFELCMHVLEKMMVNCHLSQTKLLQMVCIMMRS